MLTAFASLLAPRLCLACGRALPPEPLRSFEDALCAPCRAGLRPIARGCRGCGRDLGPHAAPRPRCAACRRAPRRALATTTALLRYRGPARALLRRLKYHGCEELAAPLGEQLARAFEAAAPEATADPALVVVPIPLHPWRRWRRGFNQAEAIARGVARALERPVAEPLRRERATRPLYGVRREARASVVEHAFALARGGRDVVAGRPVALVDDIRTSGATLQAAAAVLRAAGAREVHGLAVAR